MAVCVVQEKDPLMRRVALVGLDGASLEMLEGFARVGVMPNLAAVLKSGGRAPLRSTIPMYTIPSWTTCFTGVDPGRHEVLYWRQGWPALPWKDDSQQPFSYLPFGRFPMLWDAVEALGGTATCLDIPLGYPAPELRGSFSGGLLAIADSSNLCSPPDLVDDYEGWLPEVVKTATSQELRRDAAGSASFIRALTHQTALRRRFLADRDPGGDLLCLVNATPDRLSHLDWEPLRRLAETGEGSAELIACWRELDGLIGDARDWAGRDGTLIMVSDHGSGVGPYLSVGRWMVERGFLRSIPARAYRAERAVRSVLPGGAGRWLGKQVRRIRGTPSEMPATVAKTEDEVWPVDLDYRACYLFVHPEVDEARKAQLLTEITSTMAEGVGLPPGQAAIVEVLSGADLFPGRHEAVVPDLVFLPRDDWILSTDWSRPVVSDSDGEAAHHRTGIVIASGPDVDGGLHEPADMIDVYPTVLAAMDHRAPAHATGERIEWIASEARGEAPRVDLAAYRSHEPVSVAETRELEAHLRALGYID